MPFKVNYLIKLQNVNFFLSAIPRINESYEKFIRRTNNIQGKLRIQ